MVGIDGTGLRQVTEPSWGARDPAWSPDDVELVFAGDAGDGEGLYVMAPLLEGAAPHRITERGLSAESDPSWSPDGAWIAFSASTDPAGDAEPINFDLFVTRADASGELRHLTDSPEASDVMPAWSPDGELLAFITGSNALDDSPTGGIAVIRPDGSGLRILTDEHAFELNPTWAPDGSVIAFDRDDPAGTSIFTIRPDGSDLTRIALGSEPAWQPLLSGSLSPAPSSSSTTPNLDLGLGFPVCNISAVTVNLGAATLARGAAFVATKMGDVGGCPPVVDAFNLIAIDLDGDGLADIDYGPIECELECRAFSSPDLNGDGRSELLVVQRGGTELALGVFAIVGTPLSTSAGLALLPVEIATPGDPGHGFHPARPAQLFVGGDAGNTEGLSCERSPNRVLLIQRLGSMVPFDSPDAVWKVHETTFTFEQDGKLHVFHTRNYQAPGGSTPFGGTDVTDITSNFPCAR